MTLEIPLSRGLVALVDDVDYERVAAEGSWHAHSNGRTVYARRNQWVDGRCITTRLHNFITGLDYVDHANGNGLDNRRSNLRAASHAQNMGNKRLYRNNTSGFKGVGLHKKSGLWQARLWIDGHLQYFGLHATPEEAARAYDAAALQIFGKFARLNFPLETS